MAFIETEPNPGIPKKLSRRSEPVKRYGIDNAIYVMIGMSELGRTCLKRIEQEESPFDFAVKTYGL
jgi:hypothetical protein